MNDQSLSTARYTPAVPLGIFPGRLAEKYGVDLIELKCSSLPLNRNEFSIGSHSIIRMRYEV
jgi:hypothetical protein